MNTVKKVSSPIILKVSSPSTYKIVDLFAKAAEAKDPLKFTLSKAVQNADGFMSPIDGVSDQVVDCEIVLNGAEYRNSRRTVALFKGYICGAVALPGRNTRVALMDDKGQPTSTKEEDDIGFTGDATYVEFVFDGQTGEIRRYVNAKYDVRLGTMSKNFPIDDPTSNVTPVPTVCRKAVREEDINP